MKKKLTLFLLLIVVSVAFLSSLDNQFTNWDDNIYLLENPLVREISFSNLKTIFSELIFATYSPLTQVSFAFEYSFFKYNPFFYHLDNLLLHLGVVSLVFFFVLECGFSFAVAGFAALLFGLHPIHVESVTWVASRKDVLYAFFYMASLFAYVKYLNTKQKKFYWLALSLGIFSILSKAMAVSLPLVLFACDYLVGRKFTKKCFLDKIPFLFCVFLIASLTVVRNTDVFMFSSIWNSLLVWIWSFVFYINKFFAPLTLVPIYELGRPISLMNPTYLLSVVEFCALGFLILTFRKNRLLVFSFLFYFLSIFFLLRFDQNDIVSNTADRYMYLPCLGFCIALAAGMARFHTWIKTRSFLVKMFGRILLVVVFVLLFTKTYVQNNVWQDSRSLWHYVLKHTSTQARAYDNLAALHIDAGEYEKALGFAKKSWDMEPDTFVVNVLFGTIYYKTGLLKEAQAKYKSALNVFPDHLIALNNYGLVLRDLGETEEAKKVLGHAIKSNGHAFEPRRNLALIYETQENFAQAQSLYQENLAVDSMDVDSLLGLLKICFSTGQDDKAQGVASEILSKKFEPDFLVLVGSLFAHKNHRNIASKFFFKALSVDPVFNKGYLELGKLLANSNKFDAALHILKQGLKMNVDDKGIVALIKQIEELKDKKQ